MVVGGTVLVIENGTWTGYGRYYRLDAWRGAQIAFLFIPSYIHGVLLCRF